MRQVPLVRFLTLEEYRTLNEYCSNIGFDHCDIRAFKPGFVWAQPWLYNPEGNRYDTHPLIKSKDSNNADYLSPYYWKHSSAQRPPLCVVLPSGEWWDMDKRTPDGGGWKVAGDPELLNLTCLRSIVTKNYRGYLRRGIFCADLDGKDSNLIYEDIVRQRNKEDL
jgi:hypothetical protein